MNKCRLCKENIADQTGSHILSAFIVSSQIGTRGSEKGYLIDTRPESDYWKNMGDKGIKEDYILCRICERRIALVEDFFASEITNKIEKHQYEQNFPRNELNNSYFKLNPIRLNVIIFQLFVQSIVWRTSISKEHLFNHFCVSPNLESKIRENLDLFLPSSKIIKSEKPLKSWIKLIDDCISLFDFLPFVIFRAENIINKDRTYNYFDKTSMEPYHLMINEYLILVFENNLLWSDDFFELKSEFEFELRNIINNSELPPTITLISSERYFKITKKLQDLMVNQRLERVAVQCVEELRKEGIPITQELLRNRIIEKVQQIKLE